MKKISLLLSSIYLVVFLAGCGSDGSTIDKVENKFGLNDSDNKEESGTNSAEQNSDTETSMINEIVSELNTRSVLTIEYGRTIGDYHNNYMDYRPNLNRLYAYENSREIEYPNEEKKTFKVSYKKIDDTTYGTYINDKLDSSSKVLSDKKSIKDILGVSVDATEIKSFTTYKDIEWEEIYPNSSFSSVEELKDLIRNSVGEENNSLRNDGKVYDKSGNLIKNSSWQIEGGILKIKYYDEIWYKVENGKAMELWKADTGFLYAGVTREQADNILKKLDSSIISSRWGFTEKFIEKNKDKFYYIIKQDLNDNPSDIFHIHHNTDFGESNHRYSVIANGNLKWEILSENDTWQEKILQINPTFMTMCGIETWDSSCSKKMQFYIALDEDSAIKKSEALNGN